MWAEGIERKSVANVTPSKYDERLLNPKAFGGMNTAGKHTASAEDMFNSKGELNAYSKEDAINQQMRFAQLRANYQRPGKQAQSYFTPEERQRIVESVFAADEQERLRFGAEMIPFILDRLDYEGFIRQVFRTHQLAQGQINSYEKDVNVTALVIHEDGQTIESVVKGNRIFPPEFLVTAMPKITISEIATRQYDIVDRTHDKTTFQIMLTEDRNGLRELYQSATLENSLINVTSTISKSVLETLQYEVERHRLLVDKFIMNRAELGDLKKNINAIDYDPITSRDLLLTGIFGSIWGVNIYVTAGVDEAGIENVSVPEGMIFAVTEGRYLGAMPIRVDLTVLPADQFIFGAPQYGWLFVEQISQVVVNPRSVACAVKSSATVPQWMSA